MSEVRVGSGVSGRGSEAGFTLVEALVAIVILVFGLVAVTNLMLMAASSNTVANQSTAAAAAAAETLETLKAIRYDDPLLAPGGDLDNPTGSYWRDSDLPGVGKVRTTWRIDAVVGNNQVKFITVRSQGTGALAGMRSRAEFTTFRSCTVVNGLNCPNP